MDNPFKNLLARITARPVERPMSLIERTFRDPASLYRASPLTTGGGPHHGSTPQSVLDAPVSTPVYLVQHRAANRAQRRAEGGRMRPGSNTPARKTQ